MRALVTGGSGYFGEILVARLKAKNYSVRVLDLNKNEDLSDEVEFFQGDIRDKDLVLSACQDIDVVFHNVAQVPLAKDQNLFRTVNIDGTLNALSSAKEANVRKFVYTSSSAIFGVPKENPVKEDTPPSPMEAYGQAKYEGELLCKKFSEDIDISIVRPRTILGHGRLGIFQILFEWVRTGKNVPVFNGGHNIYQFVHSDDLAECCILASKKEGFNIFNCGAKHFGTMRQLLQALVDHANTGSKVKSLPMAPATFAMNVFSKLGLSPLGAYHSLMYGQSMYFDTSKIESDLNFVPKHSNEDMIVESYDWYLKNLDSIQKGSEARSHHKSSVKQGILKLVGNIL